GSSVVAALAALAPRLVRLAHHGYSDSLLVPERVTREGQEHVLEGGAPAREVEAVERAEDARPGLAVAEIEVEDLADALGPPRPGAQARDGARILGLGPREGADAGGAVLGELREAHERLGARDGGAPRDTEVARVDDQVLLDAQVGVEALVLLHDAEPALDGRVVGRPGGQTEDGEGAGAR